MTSEYDCQIAVRPVPGGAGAPNTFTADLAEGWVVGGAVNGGYLLSVLGNSIRARLAHDGDRWPHPFAVSAFYVSASTPGQAVVRTTVKRLGGSLSTVAADVSQGDTLRMTALATFGDLGATPGDIDTTAEEPRMPPPEECLTREQAPRAMPPLFSRFDMRFPPDQVGWALGQPGEKAELGAWFRFVDRQPDPLSLLLVVDALPPVTLVTGKWGWAPTLELSVHVRAVPAPGWLKVRHVSRNMAGGMFEEDCEVWDSAGRLVAQSRQLARLPRPNTSVI